MTITVHPAEAASRATMTCEDCGSIKPYEPGLPYIKQALDVRLWHLKHFDCAGRPGRTPSR